jgi:hypothetical protein
MPRFPASPGILWEAPMAKKAIAKSRPRAGAKAAMAERSKDSTATPKKKAAFGKRSKAARVAHAASPKSSASKTTAKPVRKSIVGKAVGAVSSTVSSVAEQATSLFKRGRAEKTR